MRCSKCGVGKSGGPQVLQRMRRAVLTAMRQMRLRKCSDREILRRMRRAAKHPEGSSRSPAAAVSIPAIRVAAERAEASSIEGERKTVTALFADIKGSTELIRDLDPEEARAIVDPALKLMIDAAHRYDGYVVQSTGDGIFALFGAPVAHEDHPQRALLGGAPDAAGDQKARRVYARRGACADPDSHRTQYRRSGRAPDSDRRAARRVHAYRPYGQPGIADANAGRARLCGSERGDVSAM